MAQRGNRRLTCVWISKLQGTPPVYRPALTGKLVPDVAAHTAASSSHNEVGGEDVLSR